MAHAKLAQLRDDVVPSGEVLSLVLAFWRGILAVRTPRSVEALDELIYGYETYTNYRPERLTRIGRICARLLESAHRVAVRRRDGARECGVYARRCERSMRRLLRKHGKRSGGDDMVVYTLMFLPENLHGPHAPALENLVRRRYLLAGGAGTALLLSPRWFHDLMTGIWPAACWGSGHVPSGTTATSLAADAEHAGLGCAHDASGLDLDALRSLWDSDPLQLYFDIDEVLTTLRHV